MKRYLLLLFWPLSLATAYSDSSQEVTSEIRWKNPRFSLARESGSVSTSTISEKLNEGSSTLQGVNMGLSFEFGLSDRFTTTLTPNFSYMNFKDGNENENSNRIDQATIMFSESLDYNFFISSLLIRPAVDIGIGYGSLYEKRTKSSDGQFEKLETEVMGPVYEIGSSIHLRFKNGLTPFARYAYRSMYADRRNERYTIDTESEITESTKKDSGPNKFISSWVLLVGLSYYL